MIQTVHGSLACYRPRCEPVPVRLSGLRGAVLDDLPPSRLEPIRAAAALFAEEWPVAAGSVEAVEIVSSLTAPGATKTDVACSITDVRLTRVSSRVQLLLSLFLRSDIDELLYSWHVSGDIVSSSVDGIFWHEIGHSLLNLLVLRAHPTSRSAETAARLIVTRALRLSSTADVAIAASQLSRRAVISCEEFVAEAMADFGVNGHRAHYMSVTIVMVLAELWKE
jgi:hypothetical protein